MIIGLHHPALSVPDLEKAIDFYTTCLGFELATRESWREGTTVADNLTGLRNTAAEAAILKHANTYLELIQHSSPVPKPQDPNRPVCDHGIVHLCFEVDDLQSEYERLVKAGMRFHCEPQELEDGWLVYGRDPFGNAIELQELTDPNYPHLPWAWTGKPRIIEYKNATT